MSIERGKWYEVSESKRTYFYPCFEQFVVLNVARFKVTNGGRHYLQKKNGKTLIMSTGWTAIKIDGPLAVN